MVLYARITKTSRMGAGGNHFLFVQLSSSTSCPSWSLCWEENLRRVASLKCGRLLTCQVKSKGRTPAVELTADEKGQLVYRKVFYNLAIDLVGHSRVWPSVSPHVTGGLGLTGAWNWEKKARGISLPLCCPSVDVVSGGSGFLGHIYHATYTRSASQEFPWAPPSGLSLSWEWQHFPVDVGPHFCDLKSVLSAMEHLSDQYVFLKLKSLYWNPRWLSR